MNPINPSPKYNPAEVEDKWYAHWLEKGFFHAQHNSGKEPFCIVIPPPNVTGVLHMGHMLNNTIQDILVRKARMQGKEACWVPGTDHASIATEARVVGMLRERGIKKSDLSRDEFLKYAWEWKEKYGGIILEQLKKLGASCDWERTNFTMDPDYYKAVIRVFVDLYKKGYIYRGLRMINWDCEAKTALSNEEVLYKEDGERSILYSVRYKIKGSDDEWVTIATQRPETILGDVAIAVNPTDERYKKLVGKKVLVPFIHREIPIITDDYVDKTFGTGCLKVTPAHDVNDYEIGLRHLLPVIDTINDDGTLNEKCELPKYVGKDRFAVRKEIVKDLREAGHLVKEEEFITRIGRSERTNSVVEPKLSLQWFVKMKEISNTALKAVENDEIKLHPAKFKNTYRHWMENVRDWCISRQLWWGHRIPAYYFGPGENDFVVAETPVVAVALASQKAGRQLVETNLRQDADVLDTWASSWLWPMQVFGGFDDVNFDPVRGKIIRTKNKDLNYFYPTQVLVTAPEILFFWVARMIIAGYEYMDEKPFEDVYLTGIVRDKLGRKMSKSLGNSPDPLDLITRYGADGVRTGMLFSSPAGNDLPFDEKLCEQGRNFANKIWNAFRLVKGWQVAEDPSGFVGEGDLSPINSWKVKNEVAIQWFTARVNQAIGEINDHFNKFRISDALMTLYRLIWDDLCSWYLEMVKPEYGQSIDQNTYNETIEFFEILLKLLHPFMPFITEELWHKLKMRNENDCIMMASWPKQIKSITDPQKTPIEQVAFNFLPSHVEKIKSGIGFIRKVRQKNNLKNNDLAEVYVTGSAPEVITLNLWKPIIETLSGSTVQVLVEPTFPKATYEAQFEGSMHWHVKKREENKDELIKDLEYYRGFLASVNKKLQNEKFVTSAPPHVIELERAKKADAEIKIKSLEEKLNNIP